jgi:hypothetical protein
MKQFLELPFDPSGYGDFGVSYIGIEAKIHFEYRSDGKERIGELRFGVCVSINVNGHLDKQERLPYNRVMIVEERVGSDKRFTRFMLMLSGSDFQFDVVAKDCEFTPEIIRSDLILSS